jgi:hypothetical protein
MAWFATTGRYDVLIKQRIPTREKQLFQNLPGNLSSLSFIQISLLKQIMGVNLTLAIR